MCSSMWRVTPPSIIAAQCAVTAHDEEIGFLLVGLRQNRFPIAVPPLSYRFDPGLIS